MSVCHCRSAPPCPYWSNIRGSSKIWRPPIVEVMTTKMIVARSWGTVMEKKVRIGPAPSMRAAS